jgi:hypothetical protein
VATTALRLAPATIAVAGGVLDMGAAVMYATVDDGVVTAITYGLLPASTAELLYVDLSGYLPPDYPAVGWYFQQVCRTFSPNPPVIPAGDIAPPYTPGLPPPTPGDPNFPPSELPPVDDRPPLANTTPVWVSFHADGAEELVAAGGSGYEEVDPRMRTLVRLIDVCAVRLQAHVVTGGSGSLYLCHYDPDLLEWVPLSAGGTGPSVPVAAAGTYAGLFVNPNPALSGDVLLNVCTRDGSGATVGNLLACFFVKSTTGVCVEFPELSGEVCPLGIDTAFTDDGTVQVWDNAVLAQQSMLEFYDGFPYGDVIFTGYMGWREPEDAASYMDPADPRGPCAVMVHNEGGTEQNLYWVHNCGDTPGPVVTLTTTQLDPALVEQTGTVTAANQQGLLPMYCTTGAGIFKIHLQAGRVWVSRNNADPMDIGDATLLVGEPKEIVCELVGYTDSGTPYVRVAVYYSDLCTVGPRTLLGERVYTGIGGSGMEVDQVYCWEWLDAEEPGEQRVWQIAVGRTDAAGVERLA